eukprot:TRINITY_DN2193_c0_g2_i1.p1 TRINITY_DN2193_c0_g2~~TRINITY_DN2193_c0_g2_i1.p1  ORF type:complete len:142 (-),score=9.95 TRINITY_DN2193_c0_g2_i1:72-497(-)
MCFFITISCFLFLFFFFFLFFFCHLSLVIKKMKIRATAGNFYHSEPCSSFNEKDGPTFGQTTSLTTVIGSEQFELTRFLIRRGFFGDADLFFFLQKSPKITKIPVNFGEQKKTGQNPHSYKRVASYGRRREGQKRKKKEKV